MVKVLIYTTTYCAPCAATKKYLDHLNVKYTTIDVTDNQKLRIEISNKAGATTVPIIQRGSKFCVGFKPAELKELVK